MGYAEMYKMSIEDPEAFWGPVVDKVFWYKKPDQILDDSNPPFYRWFVGGVTNMCYNAVDRWVNEGKADQPAYIWVSAELGTDKTITYGELQTEVIKFASVLKNSGVEKGDRVIIYLPMIPEACIAALACVRIGAIHSIVFAGFSMDSLAVRIDDAQPKMLICADAGQRSGKPVPLKPIVDDALDRAEFKVPLVVLFDRGLVPVNMVEGRDVYWADIVAEKGGDQVECEQLASTDPSYILYTSGTTGKPKGAVRDTAGYIVALYNSMETIYGCQPGEIYWAASDVGWVVGHSYIIYAPLFYGLTSIIYEGTPVYPDPGIWFRTLEKYKVDRLFTSPTAFRVLKKFDESNITQSDLSNLKVIFLAGEPLDAPTWEWATRVTGNKPIVDHYWQTESGWAILTNPFGTEEVTIKPGSPTFPSWGWNLKVIDNEGNDMPNNEKGFLVATPPLPPGCLMTLYNDDDRFVSSYYKIYPGFVYATGDYAIKDDDGYYFVLGRADEVIKVAGHRLGTREIEEAISSHPAVAEQCTIGIEDEEKGQIPVAMVVLKEGVEPTEELKVELNNTVRKLIGPIAALHAIKFVSKLPKTRSGKILRRVIKAVFEGKDLGDLSTIEDGTSVDEIREALAGMDEYNPEE
ncbi:MAG TPA: acetate--CoA ligase [Candidatus Lokiarchaeia archaeon]|nr:acetate--CoA ligase [Candidatus Lokiarchaeia archaeon]